MTSLLTDAAWNQWTRPQVCACCWTGDKHSKEEYMECGEHLGACLDGGSAIQGHKDHVDRQVHAVHIDITLLSHQKAAATDAAANVQHTLSRFQAQPANKVLHRSRYRLCNLQYETSTS